MAIIATDLSVSHSVQKKREKYTKNEPYRVEIVVDHITSRIKKYGVSKTGDKSTVAPEIAYRVLVVVVNLITSGYHAREKKWRENASGVRDKQHPQFKVAS